MRRENDKNVNSWERTSILRFNKGEKWFKEYFDEGLGQNKLLTRVIHNCPGMNVICGQRSPVIKFLVVALDELRVNGLCDKHEYTRFCNPFKAERTEIRASVLVDENSVKYPMEISMKHYVGAPDALQLLSELSSKNAMFGLFDLSPNNELDEIERVLFGINCPNLYKLTYIECLNSEVFQKCFAKGKVKNLGLTLMFNELFIEYLAVRTINIFDNIKFDDGNLMDSQVYAEGYTTQVLTEKIQSLIAKEVSVMDDFNSSLDLVNSTTGINKNRLKHFYPSKMWLNTEDDMKDEDLLILKQSLLRKSMGIVAKVIRNVVSASLEHGFLLQYEPVLKKLLKDTPEFMKATLKTRVDNNRER